MMIQTAGGPGLVSPIDFGERRKPMPRTTLIAIGVVALAHIGIGTALYYQRFELKLQPTTDEPRILDGSVIVLKRDPPPPVITMEPPAPNPPIHRTDAPPAHVETLTTVISDHAGPVIGPVINTTTIVEPATATGTASEPAVEAPRGPSVITAPQWISRPTGDQLTRAYPPERLSAGFPASPA